MILIRLNEQVTLLRVFWALLALIHLGIFFGFSAIFR